MVALNTQHARGLFDQLELVMCQWRKIGRHAVLVILSTRDPVPPGS